MVSSKCVLAGCACSMLCCAVLLRCLSVLWNVCRQLRPRLAGCDDPPALTVAAWLTVETCLKAFQRLRLARQAHGSLEASTSTVHHLVGPQRRLRCVNKAGQHQSSPTIGPSSGVSSHLIRDVKIVVAGTVPYAQSRNSLNVCSVIVRAVLLSSNCLVSRDELGKRIVHTDGSSGCLT
jgi:hypothetical protein